MHCRIPNPRDWTDSRIPRDSVRSMPRKIAQLQIGFAHIQTITIMPFSSFLSSFENAKDILSFDTLICYTFLLEPLYKRPGKNFRSALFIGMYRTRILPGDSGSGFGSVSGIRDFAMHFNLLFFETLFLQ